LFFGWKILGWKGEEAFGAFRNEPGWRHHEIGRDREATGVHDTEEVSRISGLAFSEGSRRNASALGYSIRGPSW
jgi:hypothetical protein